MRALCVPAVLPYDYYTTASLLDLRLLRFRHLTCTPTYQFYVCPEFARRVIGNAQLCCTLFAISNIGRAHTQRHASPLSCISKTSLPLAYMAFPPQVQLTDYPPLQVRVVSQYALVCIRIRVRAGVVEAMQSSFGEGGRPYERLLCLCRPQL